ncbi:SF1B family DNA helicase RecD2 [Dyadobacter psychrotolerans]|uniref:Exodeoxyribonuclease V subunit alpha n=1 Tax=Dyadobacter psychrotolerans TaxID=2541721 RepID=A0A4R5DJG4_9BACT|nr:AAA family ATPase [Dyadobacter psychrotolerans]TDE10713.1 exodeoxyribonuclease V subunit alpha [Dyadobacter psychrotolerans]
MAATDYSTTTQLEKLSGIVIRITFHSLETGYSILKVASAQRPNEELTVVVHQSKVFAGATMDFYGEWVTHPSYGLQFKASRITERKPATANALEKYLGSGLIKGVGPVTAKRIVKHFGEKTLDVFENNIESLTQVEGIALLKLEMISKAWTEHKEIRNVMMFLQSHNISTLFAVKIYKVYGNDAIGIVQNNPYRLAADIYGIGFLSADQVALSLGLAADSPERIKAGIEHVLQNAREEGHCYLTLDQILPAVTELLSLTDSAPVEVMLHELQKNEELKTRLLPDQQGKEQLCYYAHSLYYDEQYIATRLQQMVSRPLSDREKNLEKELAGFCEQHEITLSEQQSQSIQKIARERVSVLTGGPGCGKTTTTRALVGVLQMMNKEVLLAAPTGRAAQRMSEVIDLEAKTIHRLLEVDPVKGGFKRKEDNPLETDVLIVDECSMLDVHLTAALLRAVADHTQLVLIGDADQLPAVGAGNVLKDIIASQTIPCLRLTKVFRQAQESLIISYAHQINRGEVPRITSPFHMPGAWKEKKDCLFIDSEEATTEQLRFISKVKRLAAETVSKPGAENTDLDPYQHDNRLVIPAKFSHVDLEALMQARTQTDELKEVLGRVHPWSSLRYGYAAVDMVEKLYQGIIPKYYGNETEIQILSPMTKGSLGTANLNKAIQEKINPSGTGKAQLTVAGRIFRDGDRVIQKRNNYDLNVFNGDIGVISHVDNEVMQLGVQFKAGRQVKEVIYSRENLLELDLAYAITIHKSQGSEFETVIIPLVTQHFGMLFRNLIYTGVTRAKKLVVFVGTRKALAMAVNKQNTAARQTALAYLLRQTGK